MTNKIIHITTLDVWEIFIPFYFISADSLETEGFIHCCTETQVKGVLERYFKPAQTVMLLTLDVTKLDARCVFEIAPSINELFPHVYGIINKSAITNTTTHTVKELLQRSSS